ncbi:MAG: creatininase family protein, partial [Candidatus Heimdallarchaeaceae archaeon]
MNNSTKPKSIILENLSWVEAEKVFLEYDIVVFALGARLKEHGPHLPLNNDFILAEYLLEQVIKEVSVIVIPTLQYGYYPSFLEYSGSVSINAETFKQTVVDICKSISNFGIKKFYIINTGISTIPPLEAASEELLKEGVVLRFFSFKEFSKKKQFDFLEQEGGTHADEEETSMMLYITPEKVDMSKAVKDFDTRPGRRGLTRNPEGEGIYSHSGIWGNPTLATQEKGKNIIESIIAELKEQIEQLKDINKSF